MTAQAKMGLTFIAIGSSSGYLIANYIPWVWLQVIAFGVFVFMVWFVMHNSFYRPAIMYLNGVRPVSTEVPENLYQIKFPHQRNGEQAKKEGEEDNAS